MPATLVILRPAAGEFAPYYGRYIDLVPGDDALEALATQIDGTLRLTRTLSDAQALHRYAPGKWSVKDTLGHLTDAERVFSYRAMRFARADATPLPGFDETTYVPAANCDRFPVAQLADAFGAVRGSTLAFFATLEPAALERRGDANAQAVSVRALAWIIAGHERHHVALLRERYGLAG
jgi:uncharacterized damage-inducible protein DinB